jgi:phenylpyruvate tautomerase PptA (4-oxalocrotonate tautomerase family)
MAQIKVYGIRSALNPIKARLSAVLHECCQEALGLPADKRFHRFFPMESADFMYPEGRSERYTIVELSMFEGRSVETKKRLVRLLFDRMERELGIGTTDLEITITETPKHNWGIRGLPGDELALGYVVER